MWMRPYGMRYIPTTSTMPYAETGVAIIFLGTNI